MRLVTRTSSWPSLPTTTWCRCTRSGTSLWETTRCSTKVFVTEKGTLTDIVESRMAFMQSSLQVQVWNAGMQCMVYEDSRLQLQGIYAFDLMIGCPAQISLKFNASASYAFSRLMLEEPLDCIHPTPNQPCFYAASKFYPYFYVFDEATGLKWLFTGNYTLEIIAGSEDGVNFRYYTPEERFQFNNIKAEATATIWIYDEDNVLGTTAAGLPIYNHRWNTIRWRCNPGSPCSNLFPKYPNLTPHMYFMVEFTNEGVDRSTYCNIHMKFVLHIYGFDLDARTLGLPLVFSSILVLTVYVLLYYVCHDTEHEYALTVQIMWQTVFETVTCSLFKPEEEDKPSHENSLIGFDEWRRTVLPRLKAGLGETEDSDSEEDSDGGDDAGRDDQGRRESRTSRISSRKQKRKELNTKQSADMNDEDDTRRAGQLQKRNKPAEDKQSSKNNAGIEKSKSGLMANSASVTNELQMRKSSENPVFTEPIKNRNTLAPLNTASRLSNTSGLASPSGSLVMTPQGGSISPLPGGVRSPSPLPGGVRSPSPAPGKSPT